MTAYRVCDSEICKDVENKFLSTINNSIDPCDDFYSYVCSGWKKMNTIPPTESNWNAFDVLERKVRIKLNDILEKMTLSERIWENKVMDLYKGCMNQERREDIGVEPLRSLALDLGGWPILGDEFNEDDYDWENATAWCMRELGFSAIISTDVSADEKNTTNYIIYLDFSSLGIGRNELLNSSDEKAARYITAYKKLIHETVVLLTSSNDNSTIKEDIDAIIEFETNIAKFIRPDEERRQPETLYHKMMISEIENYTEGNLNLFSILSKVFQNVTNITDDVEIIVVEPDYMKNVTELIQGTEKRVIANYIGWRIINGYSFYTTNRFREVKFEFSKVVDGLVEMKSLKEVCTDTINSYLNHAVGSIFINRTFSENVKLEIERMIYDLKDAFDSILTLSDWMDSETKRKAKDKLKEMIPLVGYPSWLLNEKKLSEYYEKLGDVKEDLFFQSLLNIDKFSMNKILEKINEPVNRKDDNWFSSPTIVNAYYTPPANTISFPAGILQFPFFQLGIPNSINYGAIGSVIGHEITHGFDDEGSRYDEFGNLREWWSNEVRQVFHNKTECFVNQYSSYRDPAVNMMLNGRNTLGENIADNGGIRAAYKAYQLFLTKYGIDNNKILPNLQLTPDQLFFIGFSYVWCTNQRSEYIESLIEYNAHSPPPFRILGTLSNNQDFYNAFGCTPESKMFSKKKCILW